MAPEERREFGLVFGLKPALPASARRLLSPLNPTRVFDLNFSSTCILRHSEHQRCTVPGRTKENPVLGDPAAGGALGSGGAAPLLPSARIPHKIGFIQEISVKMHGDFTSSLQPFPILFFIWELKAEFHKCKTRHLHFSV